MAGVRTSDCGFRIGAHLVNCGPQCPTQTHGVKLINRIMPSLKHSHSSLIFGSDEITRHNPVLGIRPVKVGLLGS